MDSLAARYLELLKKSLLDELYIENEARLLYLLMAHINGTPVEETVLRDIARLQPELLAHLRTAREEGRPFYHGQRTESDGRVEPINLRNVAEFYHTMIGRKRLDNIEALMDRVVADGVAGDVIETGVWRGGATIFMRGYLAAQGIGDRTVWVADSFAGLPPPAMKQDQGFDFSRNVHPILAISRSDVEELFRRYDLLDGQVKFLEGWFSETLPRAPVERLALMRLDGDLYESTMDGLVHLYPKLSVGGFVIVDDYGVLEPCRAAVNDYRAREGIDDPIETIDYSGVFWRKE